MHGSDSIHATLKAIWAKVTRHRNIRSNTKTILDMIFRPRKAKAKASGDPPRQDGSVPLNSKPFEYKYQKRHKELKNDNQDSDEEMEDDEENEEDEGSLFAPTESTELDGEKSDEDEGTIDPSPIELCMFLVRLPRELRDKIYGYVLKLDTSLSDHKFNFKCTSCPSLANMVATPSWQSQVNEARNLLRTCHQIRDEGNQVFYEVNSWSLRRARLRETPTAHSSATVRDTQNLFDRIRQTKAIKHFKHVDMRIALSPLAYCDFPVPDSVALNDPLAIHLFEQSQDPSAIALHKLNETAQCELFGAAIRGFVGNQPNVFPKLISITLEVSLHAKNSIPEIPNDPLDRCGITFYVRIKLGRKDNAVPAYHDNTSLPIQAPSSLISDQSLLQRAKYEAHNESLLISFSDDTWSVPLLDPRRLMLSPLKQLRDIQSVEVKRRWTVHYRQQGMEDGDAVIRVRPLRQLWRFCTVGEMLERAGPGFDGFLDPALEYLETAPEDVVDIIENTTEDIKHELIP